MVRVADFVGGMRYTRDAWGWRTPGRQGGGFEGSSDGGQTAGFFGIWRQGEVTGLLLLVDICPVTVAITGLLNNALDVKTDDATRRKNTPKGGF